MTSFKPRLRRLSGLAVLLATVTACNDDVQPPSARPASSPAPAVRTADAAQLRHGAQIFAANCAQCHGDQAQGAPDWRTRNAQGQFPPPPLDGSGHTWHHPKKMLVYTIREGTARLGGNMPAWKGRLSEQDIEDVIAWVQSLWPQRVYEAWAEIDLRARTAPPGK